MENIESSDCIDWLRVDIIIVRTINARWYECILIKRRDILEMKNDIVLICLLTISIIYTVFGFIFEGTTTPWFWLILSLITLFAMLLRIKI